MAMTPRLNTAFFNRFIRDLSLSLGLEAEEAQPPPHRFLFTRSHLASVFFIQNRLDQTRNATEPAALYYC
jgi:hypothetical protein